MPLEMEEFGSGKRLQSWGSQNQGNPPRCHLENNHVKFNWHTIKFKDPPVMLTGGSPLLPMISTIITVLKTTTIAFLLRDKYLMTPFQIFFPVDISDPSASGAENFVIY